MFILLSLKTNDRNYQATYRALRNSYPSWDEVADAPMSKLKRVLRPAGLSNQKAPRIRAILRELRNNSGRVSLDFLAQLSDQDAERYLTSLPGVGLKAARCVLMYSFDREVFPVDTHAVRIARRLGWIGGEISDKQAQRVVQHLVPPRLRRSLHVNLIRHGRAVCRAASPDCDVCCLRSICPSEKGHE
jgi:endonuclease III